MKTMGVSKRFANLLSKTTGEGDITKKDDKYGEWVSSVLAENEKAFQGDLARIFYLTFYYILVEKGQLKEKDFSVNGRVFSRLVEFAYVEWYEEYSRKEGSVFDINWNRFTVMENLDKTTKNDLDSLWKSIHSTNVFPPSNAKDIEKIDFVDMLRKRISSGILSSATKHQVAFNRLLCYYMMLSMLEAEGNRRKDTKEMLDVLVKSHSIDEHKIEVNEKDKDKDVKKKEEEEEEKENKKSGGEIHEESMEETPSFIEMRNQNPIQSDYGPRSANMGTNANSGKRTLEENFGRVDETQQDTKKIKMSDADMNPETEKSLRVKIFHLENELTSLRNDLDSYKVERSKAIERCGQAEKKCEWYKTMKEKCDSELDGATRENVTIKASLDQAVESLAALNKKIMQLNDSIKEKEAKLREFSYDASQSKKKHEKETECLVKEKTELASRLKETSETNDVLERELREIKQEVVILKDQAQRRAEENEVNKATIESANKIILGKDKMITQLEATVEKTKSELSEMTRRASEMAKQDDALTMVRQRLILSQETLSVTMKTNSELKAKLEKALAENDKLKKEMKSALEQAKSQLRYSLEKKIDSMNKTNNM